MPFKSKSQIRMCFSNKKKGNRNWNCNKWLQETQFPESLPNKVFSRTPRK